MEAIVLSQQRFSYRGKMHEWRKKGAHFSSVGGGAAR